MLCFDPHTYNIKDGQSRRAAHIAGFRTFGIDKYIVYDLVAPLCTRPEARLERKRSSRAVWEMVRVLREPQSPCASRGLWPRERRRPSPVILVMDAALHRLAHSR